MKRVSFAPAASALCAALFSVVISGCGVAVNPVSHVQMGAISGIVHGGPNPIQNATVTLYATTSGGYGSAATQLGTATTGSSGGFTFSSLSCDSAQQAYMTVQGGNPGFNGYSGTNPNYLLMAALGPCSTLSGTTSIYISEATTVAAAEALRPFMTITEASGVYTVNVGAPANNNAAIGACTIDGSNRTSGCVAAGLSHAFQNALNLANSVSLSGGAPTGQVYAVTPANSTGVVPQALLNSLANSIEACVNSAGGASGDSPGDACGNLFAATTPTGGTAPTNTLQALLNVAQYPALTPANVTALFSGIPPTAFFQPTLATAPTDYSVAIGYTGINLPGTVGSFTVTGAGEGYAASPNVTVSGGGSPTTPATASATMSVIDVTVTTQPTGTACAAPVVKFTGGGFLTVATATATATGGVINPITVTNGGIGYTTAPTVTFTGSHCTTGAATATLGVNAITTTNPGAGYTSAPTITIDPPPSGTTATATANYGVSTFDAPYALALDANDNVYIGSQNITGNNGANGFASGMSSDGTGIFTSVPSTDPGETAPRGAATDTLGNLWMSNNNVATDSVVELNATTGATSNVFSATYPPFSVAVDLQNNVWYGLLSAAATQRLNELQESNSYALVTFTTAPNPTDAPRSIAIDANQNIYTSGYNTSANYVSVFPNTGTALAPQYAGSVISTALTGNSGAGVALDSADNLWQASTTGLFQVVPTFSGPTVTTLPAPTSPITEPAGVPFYDAVDGAGNVYIANNGSIGKQIIVQYIPGTAAVNSVAPCYVAAGATTCSVALNQPQKLFVDSTGSIWVTSLTNGEVYQLFGMGAPTWPQMSFAQPGVEPQ